jgi:glycosyltransferase involved in cell wall biosynthesis
VDGVIIVDDSRLQQIAGSNPKICVSIYNSPEDINPIALPLAHSERKGFRIAYVGLLQVERGLFFVIDIVKGHPDWRLDIAGFGGDEEKILAEIKDVPNIYWFGRVGYQKTLELSQQADVLFATYDPVIPNHKYSSPNKVFEGMMLGKPLIVAKDTNMDHIIQKSDCGIIVHYGNVPELEQAFVYLATNNTEKYRLGKNARSAYERLYSWKQMQSKLLDFYDRILSIN